MKKTIFTLLILIISISNTFSQPAKREMRAVWIASVANIDWPSQRNLTPKAQREEMRKMLDEFSKANINSIVLQIRPTADAFYPDIFYKRLHLQGSPQILRSSCYNRVRPY